MNDPVRTGVKAIRIGAISLSLLAVVNGKYLNKIE